MLVPAGAGVVIEGAMMDSRIVNFLAEYRPESRPSWYGPADRQSVLQYFMQELWPYVAESLSTAAFPEDDALVMLRDFADAMHGMPVRSECGRDCRRLIDAWEVILNLRYSRQKREHGCALGFLDELAECAGDCRVFICG